MPYFFLDRAAGLTIYYRGAGAEASVQQYRVGGDTYSMKTIKLFALAALVTGMGSVAFAIPACTAGTSDVTAGGFSCTLAPLTFSNFTVTPGSGFTAATIGIIGGGTGLNNGDANIEFQIGGLQGTGNNVANGTGDVLLTYVVTGGLIGLDLNLQATPLTSGGSMTIFETACTVAFVSGSCGGTTLANFSVTSTGNNASNQQLFSSSWSGPVYIKKDIQFNGASASEFNNSQIVPEPMTFSLLGLGLLGVGLVGRRLRK